jgi:hypothetical protein
MAATPSTTSQAKAKPKSNKPAPKKKVGTFGSSARIPPTTKSQVKPTQTQDKSLHALYKHQPKDDKAAPSYTKVRATISKPAKPLLKTFYEPYWTDKKLIKQALENGKILEGRLHFDKSVPEKTQGFVRLDPIPIPGEDGQVTYLPMHDVKIWGIKNLNRAYHMDKVYVKFVNWIEWGNAGQKLTKDIDFEEYTKYWLYCQMKMQSECDALRKGAENL